MSKKIPSIREFYRLVVGPHRKLYPFLKPYLPQFIAGLVFGGLFGGVTGLVPLVLNHVSGFVFPQGHNRAAILSGADNSVHADLNTALLFCAVIPVLMIVRSLCDFLNSYLLAWCSLRILTDIRGKLYEHILKQSLDFFNRERAGNLMSRIINDTRQAQVALTSISSDLIKQPLTIVMGFGAMLYLDWKFTIASMVLVPAFLLPLLSFGKRVKKQGKLEEEKVSQLMTLLQESFTGIRVIKAFAQEKYEARNFWAVSEEGFRNSIHVRKVIEMVSPMVEAVAAVGVGCALFYVWYTHLSAGRLMALLGCVFVLYEPAKKLSRIHLVLQQCNVATTNIFEIMQNEPTIQDREGSVAIEQSTGDFRLENVTFSYRPELPPAIRNVNLHIPPGKY